MASHRRRTQYFGRSIKPRQALIRGLVTSLIEHGRIRTTVEKAKELRRHVEKAVTLAKKGDLATRRLLISRIHNVDAAATLINDLGVRFKDRPGGYTRVIRLENRPGDRAEMAFIEFVDYDYKVKEAKAGKSTGKSKEDKEAKALGKEELKAQNLAKKLSLRKKAENSKNRRRMQVASRRENRA